MSTRKQGPSSPSYLANGVPPAAVASFFGAAAAAFRAAPWTIVPSDRSLLAMSVRTLGWHDVVVSVVGRGVSFELVLFRGLDEYQEYVAGMEALERKAEADLPPHFVISLERGAEVPVELRKEIALHGWEVASVEAYPQVVAVDSNLEVRPPAADDLTLAEALLRALAVVLEAPEPLLAAWRGGAPVERTVTVATAEGALEVEVRVPYAVAPPVLDPSIDLLKALAAVARVEGALGSSAHAALEQELLRRFATSPEARALGAVEWSSLLMSVAAAEFGATLATLRATQLRTIVFELVPRRLMAGPEVAAGLIAELRALYAFLGRALGLPRAAGFARVLGGDAVSRLELALGAPQAFGLAKAMFTLGLAPGARARPAKNAGAPRPAAAKKKSAAKKKPPTRGHDP